MSGKPRENRATIASHHLGLRLTDQEHAQLGRIVTDANEKMSETGIPGVMTMTAMVRWLIVREYKRRGFTAEHGLQKGLRHHMKVADKFETPSRPKRRR